MIATIPPLWRDVDAYNQLTRDPRITTFWGHAPAYGYLAKVPLYIGEQWERWRGIAVTTPEIGLSQLTDTGVWLLIVTQHLALCGAAWYFIRSIGARFWVLFVVSLFWASNALFYTFAHCVGSETLGVILLIVFVGKGLRLIRRRSEPPWMDWYLFAIVLLLCLLSRHVNVVLILLLPAGYLLSGAQERIWSRLNSNHRKRQWLRYRGVRDLRRAVVAMAIGIACVVVANSLTHSLARNTRMHPHSRMGYTFLWRLQFLKTLSPATRIALLEKASARASSKEARQLVALLGQMHAEGTDPVAAAFMPRAVLLLFPRERVVPWEKLDVALNQMAWAFLLPPTPEHLQAARAEFGAAMKMSVTEMTELLFETTGYFFDHQEDMAGCAGLVTFRNTNAETINLLPSQHPYFHLWRGLTFCKALVIWFGSLLLFLSTARRKRVMAGTVCGFGIAQVAVGLLAMSSACLVSESLPRYALPMWQLLLLSFYILVGSAADPLSPPKAVTLGGGESPPGSQCRPEP
jgi:hypothetical protein